MHWGWGMVLLGVLALPAQAGAEDAEVAGLQERLQAQQEENARLRREHDSLEDRIELLQSRIDSYRREMSEVEGGDAAVDGAAGADAR